MLRSLRGVWDEEAVDELDHALQAGERARVDGADDELVLASALHDIGHSPIVADSGHIDADRHDQAAYDWLVARFTPRVAWLAGAHVVAKRWLVATDLDYATSLSAPSVHSLARQGGAGGVDDSWTRHPWWPDAVRLRTYDDAAKTPGAAAMTIDEVVTVAARVSDAGR